MTKLSQPSIEDEDSETSTIKRTLPAELLDARAGVHATTKRRNEETGALLTPELERTETRRALSQEEIERFERRERETLPAPPEPSAEAEDLFAAAHVRRSDVAKAATDIDAEDER